MATNNGYLPAMFQSVGAFAYSHTIADGAAHKGHDYRIIDNPHDYSGELPTKLVLQKMSLEKKVEKPSPKKGLAALLDKPAKDSTPFATRYTLERDGENITGYAADITPDGWKRYVVKSTNGDKRGITGIIRLFIRSPVKKNPPEVRFEDFGARREISSDEASELTSILNHMVNEYLRME